MPVAIALIGIVLIIAAWQNTIGLLGETLASDFDSHFIAWLAVVLILGGVGYVSPAMRGPSRALLALVLIGYFLSNQGIFAQFKSELSQTYAPPANTSTGQQQTLVGPAPLSLSGSGAGSAPTGAAGAAGTLSGIFGGVF